MNEHLPPVADGQGPFLADVPLSQPEEFFKTLIMGKDAGGLGHLSKLAV